MTTGNRICLQPLTHGDWTAYLVDRATGVELPLERNGWLGSAGRARSQVSEASVVLDPDYATRLRREPRRWLDELLLRRDGRLQWVGPISGVTDDDQEGVVWEARDRMAPVMERRWFWRTGNYSGDQANLMTIALNAADYTDPVGLRRQPIPTGVITDMPVIAGDKVGQKLDDIGVEWTVIGDVVRYGDISVDAETSLAADAWGNQRPTIVADGFASLTHVCAVTTNQGRAFYPSADPYARKPGSTLLVDTIDVGDVSIGSARELARAAWLQRQGDLSIVANDRAPVTDQFPLSWQDLVPGAVMRSTAQGRQLTARNAPLEIDTVSVDIADGVEGLITTDVVERPTFSISDPDLADLALLPGVEFPPAETYPLDPLPDIDWAALDLDPEGEWEPGGLPAPFPGFEPVDAGTFDTFAPLPGLDPAFVDPYADCPPEQCCDLCAGTSTPSGGGPGFYIRDVGTHDFNDLRSSPIVLCGEEYGVYPNYAPGDLLVAHCQGNNDAASISFDAGSGWTEYVNGEHDAAIVLVAAAIAEPGSFEIVWPEAETNGIDGQICAIAGASGVNQSAFKNSDVDGFSGSSNLPQVTTTVDGCLLLYGSIGSGNEIGDVTAPGLKRLRFNLFDQFCVMFWERQTTAGLTPARTITYPGPEFRTEWVLAVAPAG